MHENRNKDSEQAAGHEERGPLRYRMQHEWDSLIDDLIEEGRSAGAFDNLAGEGRPLDLRRNIFAAEQQLAHDLLQNNDLRPVWITRRQALRAAIASLRQEMRRVWRRYELALKMAPDRPGRDVLGLGWDEQCRRWQRAIDEINSGIDDFNLKRPGEGLEMYKLELEDECRRAGRRAP